MCSTIDHEHIQFKSNIDGWKGTWNKYEGLSAASPRFNLAAS